MALMVSCLGGVGTGNRVDGASEVWDVEINRDSRWSKVILTTDVCFASIYVGVVALLGSVAEVVISKSHKEPSA